jgi:hypothetical protein
MGLDKGKGEGELKDGFVFSCCHILLLFFGLPFSMQVNWFLIKIKSIVGWASLAKYRFQPSKFGHHISVKQLKCESQLWQIVVFGIGTRQGCKIFKVVPPHLILDARICVCIITGSPDRVIDALRQVN